MILKLYKEFYWTVARMFDEPYNSGIVSISDGCIKTFLRGNSVLYRLKWGRENFFGNHLALSPPFLFSNDNKNIKYTIFVHI
jgi:hypothetical protein